MIPSDEVPGRANATLTPQFSSTVTMTSETVVDAVSWISSTGTSSNASLPAWQTGHRQSAGSRSKGVPGGVPVSGSPFSSSYTYPQTLHFHPLMLAKSPDRDNPSEESASISVLPMPRRPGRYRQEFI